MTNDSPDDMKTVSHTNRKDFAFASKEGLIIVSLILFGIYAFWYKIFEFYYYNKLTWLIIFPTFSLIVLITMTILLITGIFVFWKDRKYLIVHEKFGGIIFLIGTLFLFLLPVSWAVELLSYEGALGSNTIIFMIMGLSLCIVGSLILARTGGFFSVWIIGILIYMIIPLNGLFGIVPSEYFGPIDDFLSTIGIFIVLTSFILFLYHDLKFIYLSRIIKKGNKYRKEKQYKSAIICFNKALKIYPLFTTAWNNMGNVYFNQGKPEQAIKCYKKALSFNPEYSNAKKNLNVIEKKMKK
jgi:tetratricopeptide (TPR) repeat protein